MILAKPNIPISRENLVIQDYVYTDNLKDILMAFANNGILWVNDTPAYIDEIRADYNNGELFIPLYKQDKTELEGIPYNCRIEKYIIHSLRDGNEFKANELIIQPIITNNIAYRIHLNNIKLRSTNADTNAVDLFNRYIAYSYGYTYFENDLFKYKHIKKSDLSSNKRQKLKELGLHFYGEYVDLDYRDVRQWKFEELLKRFDSDRLQVDKTYEFRRLNFELELYTRICSNILWDNWTDGTITELLNDKREFIKYKENCIYLIFKKKWIYPVRRD